MEIESEKVVIRLIASGLLMGVGAVVLVLAIVEAGKNPQRWQPNRNDLVICASALGLTLGFLLFVSSHSKIPY
jgi:hypothetical protein